MPSPRYRLVLPLLLVLSAGCSSSPPPEGTAPPPRPVVSSDDPDHIVAGASDTVGAIPGSPNALYTYRFKQIDPSSDRFTFQDRDLSFYFRPSPTALYFQVENRHDRPVWLEWDRCQFVDAYGSGQRIANADTRWDQRLGTLPPTQIGGLQRYSNYVFPSELLIDPASSREQLHRPLFPEDETAPQFTDREFGVVLVFRMQDRLQPYTFRFKVRSVLAR